MVIKIYIDRPLSLPVCNKIWRILLEVTYSSAQHGHMIYGIGTENNYYHQNCNTRRTKSENLNVSRLAL